MNSKAMNGVFKALRFRHILTALIAIVATVYFINNIGIDDGYDEGIAKFAYGLKFDFYNRRGESVLVSGELSPAFIDCINQGERIYNVSSFANDESNDLWLENDYGLKLRRVDGRFYQFSLLKRHENMTSHISHVYSMNCSIKLLGLNEAE